LWFVLYAFFWIVKSYAYQISFTGLYSCTITIAVRNMDMDLDYDICSWPHPAKHGITVKRKVGKRNNAGNQAATEAPDKKDLPKAPASGQTGWKVGRTP
jgi:hypothetical protein